MFFRDTRLQSPDQPWVLLEDLIDRKAGLPNAQKGKVRLEGKGRCGCPGACGKRGEVRILVSHLLQRLNQSSLDAFLVSMETSIVPLGRKWHPVVTAQIFLPGLFSKAL